MTSPAPTDEDRVCVFCQKIQEGSVQREALRVYSFEPLNPVTPGHRLFIVDEHFAFPHHEPALAGLAYSAAARYAGEQGGAYNLIVNAGDAASQTIPHVHVHYVPRERDDGLKLPWTEQHEAGFRRSVVSSVDSQGLRVGESTVASTPDEPCTICGWTGPRTQYLGDREDNIAVAHPDGDHLPDWLPRLRAGSAPPTITDEVALRELVEKGVGFDMNPTMLIDTAESVYAQWVRYAARIDTEWRSRVSAALSTEGNRSLDGRREAARELRDTGREIEQEPDGSVRGPAVKQAPRDPAAPKATKDLGTVGTIPVTPDTEEHDA